MTTPSLRLKVTDFLATDFEKEVFQELMKLKQMDYLSGVSFPLYFWYDRETEVVDLSTLEPFIKYWKSSGEFNTKLILVPEYTDDQNNFILFDIKPRGVKPLHTIFKNIIDLHMNMIIQKILSTDSFISKRPMNSSIKKN